MSSLEQLALDLCNRSLRENALSKLAEVRKVVQDLGPFLWNSVGCISVLLEEIIDIYPFLSPPSLTLEQANRASKVLALLQTVAVHQDTRVFFLKAELHQYLYPFLDTTSSSHPIERIRLMSLAVLGSLVKTFSLYPRADDTEVVRSLVSSDIVSHWLRAMDVGAELSKAVAASMLWKIMLVGMGLNYVCEAPGRLFAVTDMLRRIVGQISGGSDPRLLNHIIRCYLRLSEDQRGWDALKTRLPPQFNDAAFVSLCVKDQPTSLLLEKLLHSVQPPRFFVQPNDGVN